MLEGRLAEAESVRSALFVPVLSVCLELRETRRDFAERCMMLEARLAEAESVRPALLVPVLFVCLELRENPRDFAERDAPGFEEQLCVAVQSFEFLSVAMFQEPDKPPPPRLGSIPLPCRNCPALGAEPPPPPSCEGGGHVRAWDVLTRS